MQRSGSQDISVPPPKPWPTVTGEIVEATAQGRDEGGGREERPFLCEELNGDGRFAFLPRVLPRRESPNQMRFCDMCPPPSQG